RLISLCKEGKVKEWDLSRSRRLLFSTDARTQFADPTARYVLVAEPTDDKIMGNAFKEVVLWDAGSAPARAGFRRPLAIPRSTRPVANTFARFSPDGQRVLIKSEERLPWQPISVPYQIGQLLPNPVDWLGGITLASSGWLRTLPPLGRSFAWDIPSGE